MKLGFLIIGSWIVYLYFEYSDLVNGILESTSRQAVSGRRFGAFLSINIIKFALLLLAIISSLFLCFMMYKKMKK